ncbi:MAG: tyrosine-type recombinase/integrase [Acidimicrobiia bacterium]
MALPVTVSANVIYLPGAGEPPDERPETFAEYLISIGMAARTIELYCGHIRRAESTAEALGFALPSAGAGQLARVADLVANPGGSVAMRSQLRSALKHFYTWHDRMSAPLRAVRVPPQPRMVCKALDPEDAARLVGVARGRWPEGAAVILGMFLALRREEIAAAEWDRFDDDMEWYQVFGKRSKTATLPVAELAREALWPFRGEGYLFPGRRYGRHVTGATVWNWMKAIGEEAGLSSRFTTHWMRHTALTTALDNTENLRSVMEFARHEKPETTAGYTRTTKTQLRAVADAIRY